MAWFSGANTWVWTLSMLAGAIFVLIAMRMILVLSQADGRRRWRLRLLAWRHHEFWPAWFFYLPLIPCVPYYCYDIIIFGGLPLRMPACRMVVLLANQRWVLMQFYPILGPCDYEVDVDSKT